MSVRTQQAWFFDQYRCEWSIKLVHYQLRADCLLALECIEGVSSTNVDEFVHRLNRDGTTLPWIVPLGMQPVYGGYVWPGYKLPVFLGSRDQLPKLASRFCAIGEIRADRWSDRSLLPVEFPLSCVVLGGDPYAGVEVVTIDYSKYNDPELPWVLAVRTQKDVLGNSLGTAGLIRIDSDRSKDQPEKIKIKFLSIRPRIQLPPDVLHKSLTL